MPAESPTDNSAAFEQAISHGLRFWRRWSAAGGNTIARRVFVDLLVDHPVYYLGNLVLAKYLEVTRGLKPWALVSSAADQKMILLARSFGIEQFTFVRDEVAKDARPEAAQIIRQFEGLEGPALRRQVLALNVNGLPVGDLLYDTYIRETRQVTLRRVDDDLRAYTALMLNYYALYENLLDAEEAGAVVMGHLVYLRFGLLARLAARRGAEVFARYGGKGMRIQRRRDVDGASDVMTRITPDLVDGILADDKTTALRTAETTLDRRMSGAGNEFEYLNEEGYSPKRPRLAAEEIGRNLGIDPERPKALLMLHAFPDANHFSPGLLFDDFYDWYLRTLDFVRDLPETDWLIKLHPNLAHYTDETEPGEIAADAARQSAHIHLIPAGVNTASLANLADLLVTVNGKSGLEFAGCGVPPLLAGKSFFAGLGFSEEPADIDAYGASLAQGAGHELGKVEQERALIANDLFFRRLIVDCRFLPDTPYSFWKAFDEIEFWMGYVTALTSGDVEDDPVYRAMNTMLAQDADSALRPED